MNKRILIAGEGGQGVQVIAKILARASFASGKKVAYLPNFGVEQRGGVSLSFLQISDYKIVYPKFWEADIVVILAHRAIPRISQHITKKTLIIFDNSIISEAELAVFNNEKIAIPASYLAKEKLTPRVFNTIILGVLSAELGFVSGQRLKRELLSQVASKIKEKHELKHLNLAALAMGEKTLRSLGGKE